MTRTELRRTPLRRTALRKSSRSSEGGIAKVAAQHVTVKTLDSIARDICMVRDSGHCVVCPATENLEASHIFPKGIYKSMRWLTENIEMRCHDDHQVNSGAPHADPKLCQEWWQQHLSPARWQYLVRSSQLLVKVTPWYRDTEFKRLKFEYLDLAGHPWGKA